MPCLTPMQIVNSAVGANVGLPTTQLTQLAVFIDGFVQKAPAGFKIPSCYIDMTSITNAVGSVTATYTAATDNLSLVTTNNVTVNVMTLPNAIGTGSPAVSNAPPITTQYIGQGTVMMTSSGEFVEVTIGGLKRLIPLFLPTTP